MNFGFFLSSMKNHIYILQYLATIFPILLVFGILGQITILSKYNAISFFSWGQILNDTATLLPQILVLFFGFFSAYIYYLAKTTNKEKWVSLIILFLFFGIALYLSSLLLGNNYFTSFIYSFLTGYLSYIAIYLVGNKGKEESKYDIYMTPTIFNVFILLLVFILGLFLSHFYSYLYKNTEIKIDTKNYKIKYMNDKYIFYSSGSEIKIIQNDGKYEFIIINN